MLCPAACSDSFQRDSAASALSSCRLSAACCSCSFCAAVVPALACPAPIATQRSESRRSITPRGTLLSSPFPEPFAIQRIPHLRYPRFAIGRLRPAEYARRSVRRYSVPDREASSVARDVSKSHRRGDVLYPVRSRVDRVNSAERAARCPSRSRSQAGPSLASASCGTAIREGPQYLRDVA